MNLYSIKETFWKQGFVILNGFFDNNLMDYYNDKILNHYAKDDSWQHSEAFISKSSVEVIPWFPYRDSGGGFDEIDQHRAFNQVTENILTNGWNNLYCMMMLSKKGSKGQAWHQDCLPDDPSKFNLNRLVYTHDITDETGGEIVIMPETHKSGVIPTGEPHEDLSGQIVIQPKKGSVIFLHGHCFHRVKPANANRISTNFRAIPAGTPEDITDICVYRNMKYKFSTEEVIEERI